VDWFYLAMNKDGGEILDYLRDYRILKKGYAL
jgi:hypothetical protein